MATGVELLKKAQDVVADRGEIYGTPLLNMKRTAHLWSAVLDKKITPAQVALCLIQLKVARLVETPDHEDSILDIAGYAAVLQECKDA